jgi:hypothetical protein
MTEVTLDLVEWVASRVVEAARQREDKTWIVPRELLARKHLIVARLKAAGVPYAFGLGPTGADNLTIRGAQINQAAADCAQEQE